MLGAHNMMTLLYCGASDVVAEACRILQRLVEHCPTHPEMQELSLGSIYRRFNPLDFRMLQGGMGKGGWRCNYMQYGRSGDCPHGPLKASLIGLNLLASAKGFEFQG